MTWWYKARSAGLHCCFHKNLTITIFPRCAPTLLKSPPGKWTASGIASHQLLKFGASTYETTTCAEVNSCKQQHVAAHKIGHNVPNYTKPCRLRLKNEHNPALAVQIASSGLTANEHKKGARLYHGHAQHHPYETPEIKTFQAWQLKSSQHHFLFVRISSSAQSNLETFSS